MIGTNREILNRVKMEFMEMPGLVLTHRQATRLLNLDAGLCQQVLTELVRDEFLLERPGGVFLRRGSGRERTNRAAPAPKPGHDSADSHDRVAHQRHEWEAVAI